MATVGFKGLIKQVTFITDKYLKILMGFPETACQSRVAWGGENKQFSSFMCHYL